MHNRESNQELLSFFFILHEILKGPVFLRMHRLVGSLSNMRQNFEIHFIEVFSFINLHERNNFEGTNEILNLNSFAYMTKSRTLHHFWPHAREADHAAVKRIHRLFFLLLFFFEKFMHSLLNFKAISSEEASQGK